MPFKNNSSKNERELGFRSSFYFWDHCVLMQLLFYSGEKKHIIRISLALLFLERPH